MPEEIAVPEKETVDSSDKLYFENDEILRTTDEILINSLRWAGHFIPFIVVAFVFILAVGFCATLFTWLYHMLTGEVIWWLWKERVDQLSTFIHGALGGWSLIGVIMLFRHYLHLRRNSN